MKPMIFISNIRMQVLIKLFHYSVLYKSTTFAYVTAFTDVFLVVTQQ